MARIVNADRGEALPSTHKSICWSELSPMDCRVPAELREEIFVAVLVVYGAEAEWRHRSHVSVVHCLLFQVCQVGVLGAVRRVCVDVVAWGEPSS